MEPVDQLQHLHKTLVARQRDTMRLHAYYAGQHPLPDADGRAREAYWRLLRQARSNWMALVVDAVVERLQVVGFRVGDADAEVDTSTWSRWQANHLDAQQELLHTEALVARRAFTLVDFNEQVDGHPRITVESAAEMVCHAPPGRPWEPTAAAKVWRDGKEWMATLYLPDAVYRWRGGTGITPTWVERDADWYVENDLGVVPVVEFRNRPTIVGDARSEIEDVTDIQDRINTTIFNRLLAAQFAAFRQKWATGIEIPEDPDTGELVEPFTAAVDRMFISEDADAKFGEFGESDLKGYIASVEADIQHLAAITRTPPHYLLGQSGNFPSGESLKSTETGLVAKAKRRQRHFGEAWEQTMRIAARAAGDAAADRPDAEVVWADPESRTEGEQVDALLKMSTLGVPLEVLWERWGASPQEVARWRAIARRQQLLGQGLQLGQQPAAPSGVDAVDQGA